MATTVPGIVLRETKGAELTHAEQDNNTDSLRKYVEALSARFDAIVNADGTIKDGSISDPDMFSPALIAQFFDLTFRLGDFISSGRTTAPTAKWLAMDGSAISRTTYSALFAIFATTFGTGDGSTTFNLPNAPGRAIIGSGTGSGLTARTLGAVYGYETHSLTAAEGSVAGHIHAFGFDLGNDDVRLLKVGVPLTVTSQNAVRVSGDNSNIETVAITSADLVTATPNGLNPTVTAHANMQPSLAMNFFIKVLA